MPKLNLARAGASGCFLADNVYVFCGSIHGKVENSIEKLNILVNDETSSWLLIQTNEDCLRRFGHAIAPLNSNEIIIFGGVDGEGKIVDDDNAIIFDTGTETCKIVPNSGSSAFSTEYNQSLYISPNKIVALALVKGSFQPILVEYSHDSGRFSQIQELDWPSTLAQHNITQGAKDYT